MYLYADFLLPELEWNATKSHHIYPRFYELERIKVNSPCLCMMSVHTIIGLVRQISRFLLTLLLSSSLTLRLIRWDFVETRHNFKLNALVFRYIMYIYYTNILLYQVEKMRHFNHYQSCFDIKAFLEILTFEF